MLEHGSFVVANAGDRKVIGIVLNSLRVSGVDTYLVAFDPQISGSRVVAWANQAFLSPDQFTVLEPEHVTVSSLPPVEVVNLVPLGDRPPEDL